MNKQELIKEFRKIGIYNLSIFGTEIKGIPTESAVTLIEQLDEPQPLKLKDIISRMKQLFPLSRSEWIDEILHEFGEGFGSIKYREGFEQGKLEGAWVGNQLKDADKIRQELNKPVVPQFVADWIEESKSKGWDLLASMSFVVSAKNKKVTKWFYSGENKNIFALAWILGYEVEEEKRYLVKIKGVSEERCYLKRVGGKWIFGELFEHPTIDIHVNHTRKELENADFSWVFDCPGIEIEEVEE